MRRMLLIVSIVVLTQHAWAGGPRYVAGATFFDPTTKGTPLTWSQGKISYYTDQGNLSSVLPGPTADTFVANAFSLWTSISTAAVSAVRGGQLAEDVNGSNVMLVNGTLSMPSDIQSGASATPVGIVYDLDGSVTDALLGTGASNAAYCAQNSVFGGIDNFATNAYFSHALIIINGKCALASAQLPDLQYHLARVIGRILGLDWSQANLNVITRNPPPTAADFAGFPLMHQLDLPGCIPVASCYSNNGAVNPAQPKLDDQMALSRLYPVNASNVTNFPGKKLFSQTTARIRGSVYFSDFYGQPAQPMQGVNVVARLIDPVTGLPSRSYVATSISGFLFCGNDGSVVTGYTDSTGQSFSRFGSDDASYEGFYDLAGLPIPTGATATYQLTVEAVDPLWSPGAGPYGTTSQVTPSGIAMPVNLTVTPGSDTPQDLVMIGSAMQKQLWYQPTNYASPAAVPVSGSWAGVLSGYGTADFFQFSARSNRTLSVVVTATDEFGNASENKVLPVIGMWSLANPGQSPAPANTPSAFNTLFFAESRLDAQVLQSSSFRLGIADYRGDGRPDYRYSARILYGDTVSPARASVAGSTPLTIQGLGLQSNISVHVANVAVPTLTSSPAQILVKTPSVADGVYDVQLTDAASGGSSNMAGVLTIGAGPADLLKLVSGTNPATPVGAQAAAPFAVVALAPDGITPVAGATIQFTSSPAVSLSACRGAASCTVLTDQSGMASTRMTVLSPGTMTVTAKLAPASYANPQQVQAILFGTSSNLDLSLPAPSVWIAQGATISVPVQGRLLSNGNPVAGSTLNYQIIRGTATLSGSSASTDANGYASVNLQLTSIASAVQVSVCAAPNNAPCQTFYAFSVPLTSLQIQPVAGTLQVVTPGQSFVPITVRVTDSANPPDPVLAAGVSFQEFVGHLPPGTPVVWIGEAGISQPTMPVIVAQSQATVQTDSTGLASFAVSTAGASGNLAILGSATAGNASLQFAAQQLGP